MPVGRKFCGQCGQPAAGSLEPAQKVPSRIGTEAQPAAKPPIASAPNPVASNRAPVGPIFAPDPAPESAAANPVQGKILYWALGVVALVAALVALGVWAASALGGRNGGGETATQPTAEATEVVAEATDEAAATADVVPSPTLVSVAAGQVAVLAAGGGRWETADASGALAANTTVSLPAGQRVTLISDSGVAQVALSDGTQLFLEAGTEMGLTAEATGTTLALDRGQALVRGGGAPVTVGSLFARAALLGPGLLGLYLEPSSLLFEAACLVGDCEVIGTADSAPLRLPGGQAAVVGSASTAGAPKPANFDAYAALAPDLVPRETVTP
jgi:ferric-dicitrate binding protein FerR (iron transport regulator)